MSEASRSKEQNNSVTVATANILRPVFRRWLPEWMRAASATDADVETCQVIKLEVNAVPVNTQTHAARVDSCRRDIESLEHQLSGLVSSLQDCHSRVDSISQRVDRAAELQTKAKVRLVGETVSADTAGSGQLKDSYVNFVMRADHLREKHEKLQQELESLELEHQQASALLESQVTRLHQLESSDDDHDNFKQAA